LTDWLLLIYKVPREPTSSRVYVWRKLKQIGAVLVHDSVWVLPASDRTQEQLQWLAAEITELRGEATLARAELLTNEQRSALTKRFQEQADEIYREVLTGLKKKKRDLVALSRRFQQAQAVDFFRSKLAGPTRDALLHARGETSS
jgi:polysaccharide pyruvyl transferase WcaK-like protein